MKAIQATIHGVVQGMTVTKNKRRDGQTFQIDFASDMHREEIAATFGGEFEQLCFGASVARNCTDEQGVAYAEIEHFTDSIKPSKAFGLPMHRLDLWGRVTTVCQPEIRKIEPTQGAWSAKLHWRIEVYVGSDEEAWNGLAPGWQGLVDIEFEPSQQSLPFEDEQDEETEEG